jgi:5-methyltetrahydropteroyltriglutamate--homocysteine methyltransferase
MTVTASPSLRELRRLRVDQIGSLAAPAALQALFDRNARGEVTDRELQAAQDDTIRDVIRKQEAIGLPVVTDGEFRRRNFQDSFGGAVSGYIVPENLKQSYIERYEEVTKEAFARAEQNFAAAGPPVAQRSAVAERLKLVRNVPLEEYRSAVPFATSPLKETLVSADRISQRFAHELSAHVYAGMDAFMADVIAIEREMIRQLIAAGCRYIQIDAPGYTAYGDDVSLERMRSRGEDPHENLDRAIRADNAIIAGFDDVCFGIHLCRGNVRTIDPNTGHVLPQWHRVGTYDSYAEKLFPNSATTAFCSSTTRNVPGASSPYASFRKKRLACWVSSRPRRRRSKASSFSNAESMKRASICRSSNWHSVRNAASAASVPGSSIRSPLSGRNSSAFWR